MINFNNHFTAAHDSKTTTEKPRGIVKISSEPKIILSAIIIFLLFMNQKFEMI